MQTLRLKSCQDILNYLSYIDTKISRLYAELEGIGSTLFNSRKRAIKKQISNELKRYNDILDKYGTFFREATTFNRNDLAEFFSKYFTALYGKKYMFKANIIDRSRGIDISTDLIFSLDDFRILSEYFNFHRRINVDKLIDSCQDSCLCLGGPEDYTLLVGTRVCEDLEGFPEILEVIETLVNLKLENPNLSDKRRLALALSLSITKIKSQREVIEIPTIHAKNIKVLLGDFKNGIIQASRETDSRNVVNEDRGLNKVLNYME